MVLKLLNYGYKEIKQKNMFKNLVIIIYITILKPKKLNLKQLFTDRKQTSQINPILFILL